MSAFSEYIVYVDESGDHGPISPEFPVFALAFCLFRKSEYALRVTTLMHQLKFKHFGHDAVVLHEREIRKALPPFSFLQDSTRRAEFLDDIAALVRQAPFTLIAAVIDKRALSAQYQQPENPYHLALRFGLEEIARQRTSDGDKGVLHVVFESRGKQEDRILELEFRRICDTNAHCQGSPMEPLFAHKHANHCGLQLADLIARPVGLHHLRPSQPNRAFDAAATKFRASPDGAIQGWGLKVFP